MTNPNPTRRFLRIGELARRSGFSAKALRLYEARGLLKPCTHSPAGYRLYGPEAMQRLMQIAVLRRCGFALAQIGALLRDDGAAVADLLAERVAELEHSLRTTQQALQALRWAAARAGSSSHYSTDDLLENLHMTHSLDVNLTPEERQAMLARAEQLGAATIAEAEATWPKLIAAVRAAMQAGTPPASAEVQALARRWHGLVHAATGGDPSVTRKISEAYQSQPQAMAAQGMDMEMFRYIGQAMAVAGLKLF